MKNRLLLMTLCITIISCGDGNRTRLVNGVDGKDGTSCYAEQTSLGVNIICGKDTYTLTNGENGIDATPIEYIEVCPEVAGDFKEVLLYNGESYLAFLSSADYKLQRLTVLNENTLYMTTDGRSAMFEIINNEIVCQ